MAEINDNDVRRKWAGSANSGGYPTDNGRYVRPSNHSLQPSDHFRTGSDGSGIGTPNGYLGGEDLMKNPPPRFSDITRQLDDNSYIVKDKGEHFIRDLNDVQGSDPKAKERPVIVPNSNVISDTTDPRKFVFSGATTNINPLNDPVKQTIIDYGLSNVVEAKYNESGGYKPPISPLHPFTRIIDPRNPNYHQLTNLTTFNRYHIPVADLEHRKAFRHVFFTRPECYIMCSENGEIKLSQQAEYDEDFNTSYSRMPYISKLLSPVYVTGTFGQSKIDGDNFNYLLSNRCMGLTPSGATLSTQDTIGKSIQGYTVTPGMHYEGRQGATINVTFRDTKYLEVYEFIRLWMLYIWKIKYGVFAPSFNGYRYINGFPQPGNIQQHLHPFDRAIDYTVSMFDYIMDESDIFPRYWCKYYGMYPIDVQIEGLSNSNNDALKSEMNISVTFKYAYKIENTTKSLIEFNYNAGICDNLGQPTSIASELMYSDQFNYVDSPNGILPHHVGAGAGFVGTPYIVLMNVKKDIMNDMKSHNTVTPCLRFSPITKDRFFDHSINMGYSAEFTNGYAVAQSDVTAARQQAVATAQKIKENEQDNWLTKYEKSVDNFIDKTSDKVDHFVTNPAGLLVEAVDDIFNGKVKDNKLVNSLRDLSDWAKS